MEERNQKIINAVIQKSEILCPESLALIGIYGSAATGDTYEKSDLDLLILIEDDRGYSLAEGFILDSADIGYDLYCTTWGMLESDAACRHAHLSKLLDTKLVYVKKPDAVSRLDGLRKQAMDILSSEKRYDRARDALDNGKKLYAECFLTDSLSGIRTFAAGTIQFLLDALMLYHGRYFHKGVKRTFREMEELNLPFCLEEKVMAVICGETPEKVRMYLTELVQVVGNYLTFSGEKAKPAPDNLAGTYEEMFSNWRNKMQEAARKQDQYSSFMNMASLQVMIHEIAENVAIQDLEIMDRFDHNQLGKNLETFDAAMESYLDAYREAEICPKRYSDVDAFLDAYLLPGK